MNHRSYDTLPGWRTLVPALALLAAIPGAVGAQGMDANAEPAAGFGLDVNGGYYDLGGDDFEGVEGGFGADATLRYTFESGFGLGAGGEIAFLGLEGVEDAGADLTTLYAEARYNIPTGTALRPFVAGRIGFAELSPDEDAVDPTEAFDLDGLSAGANAGVEYWLSDEVAIQGAGLVSFLSLDADEDLDIPDGEDFSGTEIGAKAGVKVIFP